MNQRDTKGVKTKETKFMRRTTEHSLLNHRRNEDTKMEQIEKKLAHYKQALSGVVVSVLATGPKVRGFKPGRGRWILRVIKSVARLSSEWK
jgi:hypothetical protein